MRLIMLILIALIAGCASTEEKEARALMQNELIQQVKAQSSQALFELTCPATGCIIASLKVANPSAAAQIAEVAKIAFTPVRSEAVEMFAIGADLLKTVGVVGLVGHSIEGIMNSVVSGQTATAVAGFNAASTLGSSGFAANANIARMIQSPASPGPVTTYNINGNGINTGSGTQSYAPISNSYNPVNPSPMVVTCVGTPPVCTR